MSGGLYPERGAGGFTRVDGTVEFYQRVRALLDPGMTVLDFGAGRGEFVDDPVDFRRELRTLRGVVKQVVGVDVDSAVLDNPMLDDAYVIVEERPLPIETGAVDLVVSDWAFEHVRDPAWVATELDRVLAPGGWICARTPNRWGYIGLGARVVPNRMHETVLRRLQPAKASMDTFPTYYRLSSMTQLKRWFPASRYRHCSYTMNNEPAYFGSSVTAGRVACAAFRLVPPSLGAVLYVFLQKQDADASRP